MEGPGAQGAGTDAKAVGSSIETIPEDFEGEQVAPPRVVSTGGVESDILNAYQRELALMEQMIELEDKPLKPSRESTQMVQSNIALLMKKYNPKRLAVDRGPNRDPGVPPQSTPGESELRVEKRDVRKKQGVLRGRRARTPATPSTPVSGGTASGSRTTSDAYAAFRKAVSASAYDPSVDGDLLRTEADEHAAQQGDGGEGGALTPRTKLSREKKSKIADVLRLVMMIDEPSMRSMQKSFAALGRTRGINVSDFCIIFCRTFRERIGQQNEEQAISTLMEIFRSVDIAGSGNLHWEVFLEYLVAMAKRQHAGVETFDFFYPSETIRDETNHDSKIIVLKHIDAIGRTVLLERHSHTLKLYDPATLQCTRAFREQQGALLAAEYIPAQKLLATSSSDRTIAFWSLAEKKMKKSWKLSRTQASICSPASGLLCTADATGAVLMWNLERGRLLHTFEGHKKMVMDMCGVPDPDRPHLLASCSLDNTVRLWDTQKLEAVAVFENRNVKAGVASIAYSRECGILGAGELAPYLNLWEVSTGHLLQRIRMGESHARVVGIEIQGSEMIVGNSEGLFKIFDLRNMTCLQTLRARKIERHPITCFTVDWAQGLLLVAGICLLQFTKRAPASGVDGDLATPIVFAKFIPESLRFVTVEGTLVRVWDALTGELLSTFRDVTKDGAPITSACVDRSQRRIFIGDHHGHMRVLNLQTGEPMREMDSHEGEVTCLLSTVLDKKECVFSGSWDKLVRKHRDADAKRSTIKQSRRHKKDVSTIIASTAQGLIVTGSEDGRMYAYSSTMKTSRRLPYDEVAELGGVSCATFLGSMALFVVADDAGNLSLWRTNEGSELLCLWSNSLDEGVQWPGEINNNLPREEPETVVSLFYDESTQMLYTGDSGGAVKFWSLAELLAGARREPAFAGRSRRKARKKKTSTPERKRKRVAPDARAKRRTLNSVLTFSAHRGPVLGVDGVKIGDGAPLVLLTWGSDGSAKLFDQKGNMLGVLIETPPAWAVKSEWKFNVDLKARRLEEKRARASVLSSFEGRADAARKVERLARKTSPAAAAAKAATGFSFLTQDPDEEGDDDRPADGAPPRDNVEQVREAEPSASDTKLPLIRPSSETESGAAQPDAQGSGPGGAGLPSIKLKTRRERVLVPRPKSTVSDMLKAFRARKALEENLKAYMVDGVRYEEVTQIEYRPAVLTPMDLDPKIKITKSPKKRSAADFYPEDPYKRSVARDTSITYTKAQERAARLLDEAMSGV